MSALDPMALVDVIRDAPSGPDDFARLRVDEQIWTQLAMGCAAGLHDFGAIWHDAGDASMLLLDTRAGRRAIVSLATTAGEYPAVSRWHLPASRPERTLRDLGDGKPVGMPDPRNWIDHGVWPQPAPGQTNPRPDTSYGFLPIEGEGWHQIPVGPVHAGIIEPGHFRFTANGELVVRLEERLGYVHKGVEALASGATIDKAARVVARISGDATVAWSFAFALAIEAALGWSPPPRASLLRGVMAELERLSHHVNDVGFICNDASVVALQARCAILREDILQVSARCFGHRLMMDRIVPGGVASDMPEGGAAAIEACLARCETDFAAVMRVYDSSPSLLDRVVTTGVVRPELAARFAAGGHVGRASGRAFDARKQFAYAPYDAIDFAMATRGEGDVNARVWVRVDEVRSSIAIIRDLLPRLTPGPIMTPSPAMRGPAGGAAMVESFRGDVFIHARLEGAGNVARLHARDPSCFQWPLLEAAIEGNIVADFPLCNKSFNCSYSGHDL
jgi:Ni,Fe-hydrogenase III large subunit